MGAMKNGMNGGGNNGVFNGKLGKVNGMGRFDQ